MLEDFLDEDDTADLDDQGRPFDEERYWQNAGFGGGPIEAPPRPITAKEREEFELYWKKIGLTKAERESSDPWSIVRKKQRQGAIANQDQSIFDIRPANDWMQRADESPIKIRKLFGDFWLEGELAILFADTGKGKSILAVQIAEALARGIAVAPFEMECPTIYPYGDHPSPILYLDFELSREQFNYRYTNADGTYEFHPNLIRAELKPDMEVPPAFKDVGAYIAHSIKHAVELYDAHVLIIDNISWLRTSNTNASSALSLMRELKALKSRLKLSILVLAHTTKRPFARPLTLNDLAGSKMIANFADTVFALGDSITGTDVRYLKQIKPRSTKLIYDATNVAIARIEKPANFLQFTFEGFADESEHLIRQHHNARRLTISVAENHDLIQAAANPTFDPNCNTIQDQSTLREKLIAECRDLSEKGLPLRAIAEKLGIGANTVRKYLNT